MKYRISLVETEFLHVGILRKYVVQKRVGYFWWVTIGYCDSLHEARTLRGNIEKRTEDTFLRVIEK